MSTARLTTTTTAATATVPHSHNSRVVQFSHFSVKELLTSGPLSTPNREVSRYHIYLESSHTVMARSCLVTLLRLGDSAGRNGVGSSASSLARYAAQHWVAQAQFQNVSSHIPNAIESLFDPDKPYFAVRRRLYDIDVNLSTSPLFFFAPNANSKLDALCRAVRIYGFRGKNSLSSIHAS